jgi:hypothetical protein
MRRTQANAGQVADPLSLAAVRRAGGREVDRLQKVRPVGPLIHQTMFHVASRSASVHYALFFHRDKMFGDLHQ